MLNSAYGLSVYLSDYLPLDNKHHDRLPEYCIENVKIVY